MATILIVDDEAAIVEMLASIVAEYPHTAITASSGAMTPAYAREYTPDLIISDVMMPEMDGFGLLEAVRAEPALTHTTVVLQRHPPFVVEEGGAGPGPQRGNAAAHPQGSLPAWHTLCCPMRQRCVSPRHGCPCTPAVGCGGTACPSQVLQ